MRRQLMWMCLVAAILSIGEIQAAEVIEATSIAVPEDARNVGEFLTADGCFDLEAAIRSGYEGPLDLKGFNSVIDPATGQPLFRQSGTQAAADHPDDIYWDNSMSPCVSGVAGGFAGWVAHPSAFAIYDGSLVFGGAFAVAGRSFAANIVSWDGTAWSPLGSGMNHWVSALAVYDDKLVAVGAFCSAGEKVAAFLAAWTKKNSTGVQVPNGAMLPDRFTISQNYPNPFNPGTTIKYAIPQRSQVTIDIFNVLGQKVRTLVDQTRSAGRHRIEWDGTDDSGKPVSTGVYMYRLQTDDFVEMKKMLLLK